MTGADLIDAVISYYDNTNVNDADNTLRRARVLHNAQMVMDEVWNFRPWSFKTKTDTVSCSSGSGDLPDDFSRFGPNGLVWDASNKQVWTESFPQDVLDRQIQGDLNRRLFAVSQTATTWVLLIPQTAAITLSVFYEVNPPALVDDSTALPIPEASHRTVLLAGTIARTQFDKNDTRLYYEKQYLMGLGRMVVNDAPIQTRGKSLPMAVGRQNW